MEINNLRVYILTTFIKHIAVGDWSSRRCGSEMGSPGSNPE